MRSLRPSNRIGAGFGESDSTDFALFDELPHSAHSLFDRHGWIHSMQVVQIDMLNAKTRE